MINKKELQHNQRVYKTNTYNKKKQEFENSRFLTLTIKPKIYEKTLKKLLFLTLIKLVLT